MANSIKKLGYILGRRIKGDILMDIDPITNAPGRLLGPAVSLTGVEQFYDEQSHVQNFTLGSRMMVDQRVYHYARAGHAIAEIDCMYLAIMTEEASMIFLNTALPAAAPGDTTLSVTVGAFQGSVVVANELIGGYVELWPPPGFILEWRRIIANTASVPAGAGGVFTITVDRPLRHAYPAATGLLIHPNIYRATMGQGDSIVPGGYAVAVGIPPIPVDNGHYYWLQTYGLAFLGPTGGAWALAPPNPFFADLYYFGGGYTGAFDAWQQVGVTRSPQRVGYALGADDIGTGQIMLQLAP